jgi:hypothetical protein
MQNIRCIYTLYIYAVYMLYIRCRHGANKYLKGTELTNRPYSSIILVSNEPHLLPSATESASWWRVCYNNLMAFAGGLLLLCEYSVNAHEDHAGLIVY